MNEFELNELVLLISSNINDQFQFWMAATFAVVIVSHTAGHRLALWARVVIAILYTATVVMLYLRYLGSVEQATRTLEQLSELDAAFISATNVNVITLLRQLVIFGGSLLAVILICMPTIRRKASSDHADS